MLGGKMRRERAETLLRDGVVRGEVRYQKVVVELTPAAQQCCYDRDAHTAADVPHKVEDAGGHPHLLPRYDTQRDSRERYEARPQTEPVNEPSRCHRPKARVQVEVGHLVEHRDRADRCAHPDDDARVQDVHEPTHQRHDHQGGDGARSKGQARLHCGVTHEALQVEG